MASKPSGLVALSRLAGRKDEEVTVAWRALPLLRYASLLSILAGMAAAVHGAESVFTPLTPCRLVDTRLSPEGALQPGVVRSFSFRGACGIPGLTSDGGRESNIATALALNIVAVGAAGAGHLTVWPANRPMPQASSINYSSVADTGGLNIANGVIVPMCDQVAEPPCNSGDVSFRAAVSPVHLVVDVVGYFASRRIGTQERHGGGAGNDSFLCLRNGVRSGLSTMLVPFLEAELSCPPGTRVCSRNELPASGCDTSRFDDDCDWKGCDGSCQDEPPEAHVGWVDEMWRSQNGGRAVDEQGVVVDLQICASLPVWCCSPD